jgi:hypothetical protein
MSDTLKKIAENYGAGLVNGSYLNGIAEAIGVDLTTSTDLMKDILAAIGGNPENSTDYLQDIVIAYGGTEPVNGNWMEAWEAITATPPAPVNTVPPALSYVYRYEGETVTTDDGTWDNSPTSFTYQWYRDATPISGETLSQYSLGAADVDTYVSCEVTAINAGGSATAPSDAIYVFDYDYGQVYYYAEDTAEDIAILQNQFMLAIKDAGVWDKLDVLCVFRGSGDGAALVDWKRLSEVTNIDCLFDTTEGFIGDASIPAYIDTKFNPYTVGVNYTQNNASRYFFPYAFHGAGPMDGSGGRNKMLLNNSTSHKINTPTPLSSTFQYTTTVNPKSIHRTSATAVTLFNGTTSASRTAASAAPDGNLYILRDTNDYADHTVAAYAAGASMVAENTAFVAAWNTYITAL